MRIRLTPEQQETVNDPHRICVLVAGRGWGKGTTVEALATIVSQKYPGAYSELINPKYSQSVRTMDEMLSVPAFRQLVRRAPLGSPHPRIMFKNGHILGIRSAEKPESLRAGRDVLAIVDEASNIPEWVVRRVIWPKLSGIGGKLFVTGTLAGENGWLWKWFRKGQKDSPIYKSWLYPSNTNKVRYGGAAGLQRLIEDRAGVSEDDWQQEYMCIPIADKAAVFRYVMKCCLKDPDNEPLLDERKKLLPVLGPRRGCAYIISIDLGRSRDLTAIVILEFDLTTEQIRVVYTLGFEKLTEYNVIAQRARQLWKIWGNPTVIIDYTGGATGGKDKVTNRFTQEFEKVIPGVRAFYWTYQNKRDIVDSAALLMEQGKVEFYKTDIDLLDQLMAYQWISKGDFQTAGAPKGQHDDYAAAFLQGVHACQERWFTDGRAGGINLTF